MTRGHLLVALKFAVSAGLLWLLVARTDLSALGARLRQMDIRWMGAALALYGVGVVISVWRWRLLLRTQSVSVPTSTLTESFLVATFFNNFLPSNIGGDVVRVTDTAPFAGSKTVATTVVLTDRGIGLVALILVAACGSLAAARQGLAVPGASYLWLGLGGTLLFAVPVLMSPRALARLLSPLRVIRPDWVDERLRRLGDALERFRRRPVDVLFAFAGALAVQVVLIGFYLCTAYGLATPLPLLLGAVVVPVSLAAQMVPISINGFGVREAVFSYFFVRLGLGIDAALALSLVGAGLIMLFSTSGGALFLLRRG